MTYDGRCLARANEMLRRRAQAHEDELNRRAEQIAQLSPQIADIGIAMRRTVIRVIHSALSAGNEMERCLQQAQAENKRLRAQRASLLQALGYPADYLDRNPLCPYCADSGYTEQGMCNCLRQLYCQELAVALHHSCGMPRICLDDFNASLYSDERKPGERTSGRENMYYNVHICRDFVKNPKTRRSLFFCGASGTGKSFLAVATAYELCAQAEYVAYVSAGTLFSCYEDDRFRRLEEARSEIHRWENCEVLILDDLGTESGSSQNAACLYQLLNQRQNSARASLICSNLGLDELARRYGAPTASRIGGDFLQLLFRGDDLRIRRPGNFDKKTGI